MFEDSFHKDNGKCAVVEVKSVTLLHLLGYNIVFAAELLMKRALVAFSDLMELKCKYSSSLVGYKSMPPVCLKDHKTQARLHLFGLK